MDDASSAARQLVAQRELYRSLGEPIYTRLGYRSLGRLRMYELRRTAMDS